MNPQFRANVEKMPPGHPGTDSIARPQPFAAGWTGALAIGLGLYVVVAVLLTVLDLHGGRALEVFYLYSDSPAGLAAVVLGMAAARHATDAAARRTWRLLSAALGVYCVGNLLNSTFWLFDRDPFPSVGDVFLVRPLTSLNRFLQGFCTSCARD